MATGVVDYNSDLVRKKWMREGLIQNASKSSWAAVSGNSKNSIVYQENDISAGAGHTVVFDYDGNLSQRAIKGKTTAQGKGEQKKKFSDKLTVTDYRLVVDNGDKFDGVNIGDLSINSHSHSRSGLADLYTRFKDQALFDAAQGNLGQAATHIIDSTTFDIGVLTDIETTLRTGVGFNTGGTRRPPEPFMMANGEPIWILKVDAFLAGKLKNSTGYQSLVYNGDVRGNNNRAFTGIIGKIGRLLIQEEASFMGETDAGASWGLDSSDIELSGMRQYDVTNNAWTGQEGFDYASTLKSRALILGAGGLMLANGKSPDYKYEETDFGKKSESAVEFWMDVAKCNLKAENSDYKQAKVADIDYGVIALDIEI